MIMIRCNISYIIDIIAASNHKVAQKARGFSPARGQVPAPQQAVEVG
jgi:hypothetical protein